MVCLKLSAALVIPCAGQQVYAPRRRAEWGGKIAEAGVRRRAEFYYQQFDALLPLHQSKRDELLAEAKHNATKLLGDKSLRLDRFALPYCSRSFSRRHTGSGPSGNCGSYSGLALETRNSGDIYPMAHGQPKRLKKTIAIRGLNKNHNHDLKIPRGRLSGRCHAGPFQEFFGRSARASGMKPPMARLTLARKIAAITLLV